MLIDDEAVMRFDPVLSGMIAMSNGNDPRVKRIEQGIYQRGDFGSYPWVNGYEEWPENLSAGCYGVCDNHEQVLEAVPELNDPNRNFVLMLTPVKRENQPESGGWRWHKWGDYIGTQEPRHEYLYDEKHIDMVFVYHIYERCF